MVDGIDLEVNEGETMTLLGPSGCGKTTTLRMVAGFIMPDSGEIWFDDRRMTEVPPHRRNTAMVFQSYALFPHMNVRQNIAFGLKMRNLKAAEQARRIDEALDMVGLHGLEARRPGQLSGGQQQRVALARAIVTRPDVLLFDEPLSNLDAKLREKVRVEIRQLQRRLGITTLYVTHDQAEALAISDRIVVMNGGRIEQVGDPGTVYRAPRTAFVADFLGATNIVNGQTATGGFVETSLGRFGLADASLAPSQPVKLSWRPEDMKVASPETANVRHAVVRDIIYRGNTLDLLVEAAGQLLRAQVDSDQAVREGDTLSFAVSPGRIRIIE
ncbi:MAG: ABC transporter ATP-binding protein [Dongiaceae bacterium]